MSSREEWALQGVDVPEGAVVELECEAAPAAVLHADLDDGMVKQLKGSWRDKMKGSGV